MLELKYLSITEAEKQAFVTSLSSYLPPEVNRPVTLLGAVDRALQSLDELAAPEICAKRAEYFGVNDFSLLAERVLFREDERVVIAGLRFRKLNREFPFVHLSANFLPSETELSNLCELAKSVFSPLSLRGLTMRQAPTAFSSVPHEKWSQTLFGNTGGLSSIQLPPSFRTEWGDPASFYPEYRREYETLLAADARKNAFLRMEELEDLREAAGKGLLMSLWEGGNWVGVVAGREQRFYGHPCLYIFEIFLRASVRGQKLARPLQAEFLAKASDRYPQVFGHIDDPNSASLRTALSLGRKVAESEFFFPF